MFIAIKIHSDYGIEDTALFKTQEEATEYCKLQNNLIALETSCYFYETGYSKDSENWSWYDTCELDFDTEKTYLSAQLKEADKKLKVYLSKAAEKEKEALRRQIEIKQEELRKLEDKR